MTNPRLHSPAPFTLHTGVSGHLIRDAFGDSCAALALRTGDHSSEEQLANAMLFTAAPQMLAALKRIAQANFNCTARQTCIAMEEEAKRAIAAAEGH